jgi:hypothetical protein
MLRTDVALSAVIVQPLLLTDVCCGPCAVNVPAGTIAISTSWRVQLSARTALLNDFEKSLTIFPSS